MKGPMDSPETTMITLYLIVETQRKKAIMELEAISKVIGKVEAELAILDLLYTLSSSYNEKRRCETTSNCFLEVIKTR